MTRPSVYPVGDPVGFPGCSKCPYFRSGPPQTCLDCASHTINSIASAACAVCGQVLADGGCPNWLCSDPSRRISRIRAIAYHTGPLRDTIIQYKYGGLKDWSMIFGRLLLAWLEENARDDRPDIIVANPTYLAPNRAQIRHTEFVIESAEREDILKTWPFDISEPRTLLKIHDTPRTARTSAPNKRAIARQLRESLRACPNSRFKGQHVLVYDDVCTTGSQLNAVAEYLIDDVGAKRVEGIVMARARWDP